MSEMVSIRIEAPDIAKFKELASEYPRQMYAAFGRVGSTLRARMRKVMKTGGGIFGVPQFAPHDDLTEALYGYSIKRDPIIGGMLARASSIQMYRSGDTLVIGWLSALEGWTQAFQEYELREMSNAEKHSFHQILGRRGIRDVPQTYKREARPMLQPFADWHQDEIPRWLQGAIINIMQKKLNKQAIRQMSTWELIST